MKSHVCQWPPPFHLARSEPTCSSVWRQSSEHWATRSCASSSRLGRRKDHALERATGCGNNFYVRKFQVKEVWTEQFVPAETSQKSVDCVDFQTSSLIEQSLENSELQEFDENSIFEDCGGVWNISYLFLFFLGVFLLAKNHEGWVKCCRQSWCFLPDDNFVGPSTLTMAHLSWSVVCVR